MTIGKNQEPKVSIVIPVYNEQELLSEAIISLVKEITEFDFECEVIIAENGSNDSTKEIALELGRRYENIKVQLNDEPNYGKALKRGIEHTKGDLIICDEIDILDVEFYKASLPLLFSNKADIVVGSKHLAGIKDKRSSFRKFVTYVTNFIMLRILVGFKGTETHGVKVFQKAKLIPIIKKCVIDKDLFTSEFIIRAQHESCKIIEIPLAIEEKRKARINPLKRIPNVLKNVVKLTWVIRMQR